MVGLPPFTRELEGAEARVQGCRVPIQVPQEELEDLVFELEVRRLEGQSLVPDTHLSLCLWRARNRHRYEEGLGGSISFED